jgi:hypothetical protein
MGGIHAAGDRWLEALAIQLESLGWAPAVDRDPATLSATARCDAPVLYFGWYASNLNGPFALPGFRFPPGAIALHIHSYSAGTLRSTTAGWAGPLVARGVTATVGNVFEPYLEQTHRPDLFFRALARGAMLVDAAYFSLPEFSWQAMLIGDPLYRPFAVSLETQLQTLATVPPRLTSYAVLRRVNAWVASGRRDEALALARSTQRTVPSLALGLVLSRLLSEAGDDESAANALGFVSLLKALPTDEWALAREAALQLERLGHPVRALELWRRILATESLPRELRVAWLPEARRAANAAVDLAQAIEWERALADSPGGGHAAQPPGLDGVHDAISEAVGDGLLGIQVEITISVLIDPIKRLARGGRENLIQLGAELFHFLRLNVDVRGGTDEATGDERLVDEDARMRVE